MFLYHYFDKTTGPFRNLSDLPMEEAKAVLNAIKKKSPIRKAPDATLNIWKEGSIMKKYFETSLLKKEGL